MCTSQSLIGENFLELDYGEVREHSPGPMDQSASEGEIIPWGQLCAMAAKVVG